jgi:hypothetical protein
MEYDDGLINFDMEEYVAKKENASYLSKTISLIPELSTCGLLTLLAVF